MPRERKQPQRLEAGPATAAWSSKDARAPRGRKTQQVAKARPLAASAAGAAATTAASPARADGPRGPGRLKTALPAGTTIPALGDSVEVEFGDRQKYVGTVTGVKKSCFTVHFPCDGTDSDLVPMKHAYRVLSRAGQKRNRALDLEDGAAASPAPSRPRRDEQQAAGAPPGDEVTQHEAIQQQQDEAQQQEEEQQQQQQLRQQALPQQQHEEQQPWSAPEEQKGKRKNLPWSPEEDEELRQLVGTIGAKDWEKMEKVFSTDRLAGGLRGRWFNHLKTVVDPAAKLPVQAEDPVPEDPVPESPVQAGEPTPAAKPGRFGRVNWTSEEKAVLLRVRFACIKA